MPEKLPKRALRVGLISLGCAKNLVDAEIMLGALLKDGVEITNQPEEADAMIVNTCSFIDSAQEESVDTILESMEVRDARRRGQAVIVAGCLPQRFREQLPKLLPEVDAFMGVDQVSGIGQIVRAAIARRAEKAPAPAGPEGRRPFERRKAEVTARMTELDGQTPDAEASAARSLRGAEAFSRTRRAAGAVPAAGGPGSPLVEVTARPSYIPDWATPRFRLTPGHFAYVKIAEGCNHPCSFCIIPRIRGSHRSRPAQDILEEARALIGQGVKELNLISQDSTYYGLDLRANHRRGIAAPDRFQAAVEALPAEATTISRLLRDLNSLPGDFWIRLLYTHPAHWTDELIRTMADCPKVARYVDIPLQHIHENMLERMRRETSRQHIVDLLRRIRAGVPGIALRTTFIVGFPGETEGCFETLLDFIRATRFERLGVFTYSREEHTRAKGMAGQIPDRVKQQRRERAMAAQHEVAVSVAEAMTGRTLRVLVERAATEDDLRGARISSWEHGLTRGADGHAPGLAARYHLARSEADAPDIDGRVYVRGRVAPGEFAWVKVVGHTDYDLIARPR